VWRVHDEIRQSISSRWAHQLCTATGMKPVWPEKRPNVASGSLANLTITPALQQALSRINDPPWNKPNIEGSAWQARRSSVLGRRTEAGRLY
jgi:hypothetical protein